MQPVSSTVNTLTARTAARAPAPSAGAAERAADTPVPDGDAPLRGRRRDVDPDRNRQAADAQRTLDYLERLGAQLQQLKADLSAQIAAQRASAAARATTEAGADEPAAVAAGAAAAAAADARGGDGSQRLQRRLQAVDDLWRQRELHAGGRLDAQLRFDPQSAARRRFTVRGLDSAALASGDRETLSFSLGNGRSAPVSVTLQAGASLQDNVRELDRALAPLGLGVQLDAQGRTVFSAPETAWTQVRDALALKGGGIRLPGGQPHRASVQAEPDAVAPAQWSGSGDDTAALRSTLQEVTQSLEHIRRVAQQVRDALERAKQAGDAAADAAWAASFAEDFGARAQSPGYEVYAAIAPALTSVNRSRVVSLLSLK